MGSKGTTAIGSGIERSDGYNRRVPLAPSWPARCRVLFPQTPVRLHVVSLFPRSAGRDMPDVDEGRLQTAVKPGGQSAPCYNVATEESKLALLAFLG